MKKHRKTSGAEQVRNLARKDNVLPERLPFFIISNMVLFPKLAIPLEMPKESSDFVDHILSKEKIFVLVTKDQHEEDSIYDVGTAVSILRKKLTSEGDIRLLLKSIARVRISELLPPDPFPLARIEPLSDKPPTNELEARALVKKLRTLFGRFLKLVPQTPEAVAADIASAKDPSDIADLIAANVDMGLEDKQEILEELNVNARLKKVLSVLSKEVEILELGDRIQAQVHDKMDKNKREYYLREQLKAIRRELGEMDEEAEYFPELAKRIEAKELPGEVRDEVEGQLKRLKRIPPASSEFVIAHTYIEWLLELPWRESTEDNLDIAVAEHILDRDHFGLEMVKKRILEFLAVRKLKADHRGPILCFLGPPGTGKTSMGRAIAEALGRKFYRFSLGGMRDEAEIRGHRRTYVGAMPGRIIQGLRKMGANNPVIMLDEIDKLGQDFRGDPSSALLEVLDPEQNDSFIDNYLNVRFDLSHVLFIATANQRDTIPAALLDRMEIIELPGYTDDEKTAIAQKYLIPKQCRENGLIRSNLSIQKRAIGRIISNYTREAGLRNLERKIAAICRQIAHEIATEGNKKYVIKSEDVVKYLGPPKIFPEVAMRTRMPGVATGLAWTPAGGEILFIEVSVMPGNKQLILTGKLGEVMRESAMAALSFVKSRARLFHTDEGFFEKHDLHIHVPAGAIPKDGPSAGITILLALISLLTGRPVKNDVAATGEITLHGVVLPVGGIKEKVLAAKRAGIKTVLLPSQNNHDIVRLPEKITKGLEFKFITYADEAIQFALT